MIGADFFLSVDIEGDGSAEIVGRFLNGDGFYTTNDYYPPNFVGPVFLGGYMGTTDPIFLSGTGAPVKPAFAGWNV